MLSSSWVPVQTEIHTYSYYIGGLLFVLILGRVFYVLYKHRLIKFIFFMAIAK